ncbi:MAG: hypothetical protein ABEJ65_01925 [bacterium]
MWDRVKIPLLFLSLGMNLAFLIVWGMVMFSGVEMEWIEQDGHWKKYDKHHDKHDWKEKDEGPGYWFYRKKLGASDTQWRKIEPRLRAFHKEAFQLCRKIGKQRNKLLTKLAETNGDTEQLQAIKERILELRREKQEKSIRYFHGKKDVLTDEQASRLFRILRKKPRCEKHARFIPERKDHYGDKQGHHGWDEE